MTSCEYSDCMSIYAVIIFGFLGFGFLIAAFFIKRSGKRSLIVSPKGIATIDRLGTPTFIGWDEMGDLSGKNPIQGWSLRLCDRSGKRKILIAGFKEYPLVIERVFSELIKRMPALSLPQTFKWFPSCAVTIDRQGIQFRNFFKLETLRWSDIVRMDIWIKLSFLRYFPHLKITSKDGRVYRVKTRKVMSLYLMIRKYLQRQKSYHPVPLPEQKIPILSTAIFGMLWGSLWTNYHFSLFRFLMLGPRSYLFWIWVLTLVAFFVVIIKIGGRERPLPQTPIRKPVRQITITILIALLFMIIGVALTWVLWDYIANSALDRAKKDVAAAGYSFNMPKNAAPVPEKENAATYLKLAAEAKSTGTLKFITNKSDPLWNKPFYGKKNEADFLGDFQIHAREGTLTAKEIIYARKLIEMHQDVLQLLDTAYEKHKLDWGMDFTLKPSYDIKIPSTGPTINFSRLLLCRAVVQARDGRVQQAIRSIKTGIFMGEAEGKKWFRIDVQIHIVICKIMIEAIDAIEPLVDPRVEEKEILPLLNPQGLSDEYMKSLQMEVFATKSDWYQRFCPVVYKPSRMLDAASYYEAQVQKLNALKLPYMETKKAWDKAEETYRQCGWMGGLIWDDTNFPGLYRLQETVTYCRLAHAAVEARLFRVKNKRWPDAVWELDKKNWDDYLDPFTEQYNLKIMRYGDGILIYSVGPQGQDNQGMAIDLKNNYYPYNLGWILKK